MKGGMRAATAIGIGYLLGRRKKLRTATLLAAATAAGGSAIAGPALRRGMTMLSNTEALNKIAPQLGELAETVSGDLLGAGKAAAAAALSSRVDALTDSLAGQAERLRNPEATVAEGADQAAEAGRAGGRAGRRAAAGAGGAARRAAGRGRPRSRDEEEDYESGDADYEADEAGQVDDDADYYDDADEPDDRGDEPDDRGDEPDDRGEDDAPPRRSTARRRSPVSRARR
jgi:hypothetical protein